MNTLGWIGLTVWLALGLCGAWWLITGHKMVFGLPRDYREGWPVRVFGLAYTKKRLGARGVANYLSNHGYRSRPGQLWSHVSVLNVLRNPAYVGKIAFRDGSTHLNVD